MMKVSKSIRWEMAHRLTSKEAGKCSNIHGHSYRAEVTVSGPVDPQTGMVMNFSRFTELRDWINRDFDHILMLSTSDPLVKVLVDRQVVRCVVGEPTAENIARTLYTMATNLFCEGNKPLDEDVRVHSVKVWETDTCVAEYVGE